MFMVVSQAELAKSGSKAYTLNHHHVTTELTRVEEYFYLAKMRRKNILSTEDAQEQVLT